MRPPPSTGRAFLFHPIIQIHLMNLKNLLSILLAAVSLAALPSLAAVYVDVETTAGTFTIELDPAARNGGAAFLGLAEGWIDWLDPQTGEPKHGVRYFGGTAASWIFKDGDGNTVLVGNLGRTFTDGNGVRNWNNGAGIELLDDITGPTGLVARSVAMVQQQAPHALDGRWAVMLDNADDYYGGRWSRIGMVVSNWGVVEALAGHPVDGNGWMENPVEVTEVRVHGDPAEIAAWRADAQDDWPTVEWVEARATPTGMKWGLPGFSRFKTRTTENLLGGWTTLDLCNERESIDVSWDAFGLDGRSGFAAGRFAAVSYPEFGGPTVTGKYSFRVEWEMGLGETNQVYQYDLDVGTGTGMVWQLDYPAQTHVLRNATLDQIIVRRGAAHSTLVSFVIGAWWQIPYYWLASPEADAPSGRYRMWEYMSGGEVWGPWAGIHRDD